MTPPAGASPRRWVWKRTPIGTKSARTSKGARGGIASVVGTTPDADWATIGQEVEKKVSSFLNDLFGKKPQSPAAPGETQEVVDPWKK